MNTVFLGKAGTVGHALTALVGHGNAADSSFGAILSGQMARQNPEQIGQITTTGKGAARDAKSPLAAEETLRTDNNPNLPAELLASLGQPLQATTVSAGTLRTADSEQLNGLAARGTLQNSRRLVGETAGHGQDTAAGIPLSADKLPIADARFNRHTTATAPTGNQSAADLAADPTPGNITTALAAASPRTHTAAAGNRNIAASAETATPPARPTTRHDPAHST
jgi:hypothetical protein